MNLKAKARIDWSETYSRIATAAVDATPVCGLTHNFYKYPARFSPTFAATAIRCLSRPGDLVLDPYMGGGTTIVEALAAGRSAIGNDLNSLAVFITRVKTTPITKSEAIALRKWANEIVPGFKYDIEFDELSAFIDPEKTRNLTIARARFIKKVVAASLASLPILPTKVARSFARCAVLRVGQWALDGRVRHTSLGAFRKKLAATVLEMITDIQSFTRGASCRNPVILNLDAAELPNSLVFADGSRKAKLVVTSPPYPGVHVLYHRWQVDGRKETPAPYWIAGCKDGNGASFYNFANRTPSSVDNYFTASLRTLTAVRKLIRDGGYVVQMLAFNRPDQQLARYLSNMQAAGFAEVKTAKPRIWRSVPNRKWHANSKGATSSASEVVLIHQAV